MSLNESKTARGFFPRHLDSPLLWDKLEFLIEHPHFIRSTYPQLDPSWVRDFRSGFDGTTNVLSWLEDKIRSCGTHRVIDLHGCYTHIIKAACRSIEIQALALFDGDPPIDSYRLDKTQSGLLSSSLLKQYFSDKARVIEFHERMSDIGDYRGQMVQHPSHTEISFYKDLIVLPTFPMSPLVITYELLLCALDKVESKFSIMLYGLLIDKADIHSVVPFSHLTMELHVLLDKVYKVLGNKAIKVFKSLEPLAVGFVLSLQDPQYNMTTFLDQTMEDLKEDDFTVYQQCQLYVNFLQGVYNKYGDQSIPFIFESYGQEKMHFYPIVRTEDGVVKMYRYGTSHRNGTIRAGDELDGEFKKQYIQSYYAREGQLPPLESFECYHPDLKHLIDHGNPGSIKECNKIASIEWSRLCFKPHKSFNYYTDVLDLLDDKAISPHLSNLYSLYNRDALQVIQKRKPKKVTNTRLIVEMLSREVVDVKSYFETVQSGGGIPSEWSPIQLMAKERELKLDPRVFSILTFESRLMASVLERNIVSAIFPYFPQQSMTMSGSEVRYRINSMVDLPPHPGKRWVTIVLDMEQWNYTFRTVPQVALLNTLNSIFGVVHYKYAMSTFTDALLVTANRYQPPGFPNHFTHWNSHLGGNQGILQKLWSLITILAITRVLNQTGFEYILTGAGDNQIISICLPDTPEFRMEVQRILANLVTSFDSLGLTIKPTESWFSSVILAYQRKYYYMGAPCPNGLKQATRAFSGGSDLMIGINSSISTAMNSGVTINETVKSPTVGILFSYIEALSSTVLSNSWGPLLLSSERTMMGLTWVGPEFGYLPFLQLPSFLYAGQKDPLTHSLALIRKIWIIQPDLRNMIAGLMSFQPGRVNEGTVLSLVENPHNLNISRPAAAESIIKKEVSDYLQHGSFIKNNQIRELFPLLNKQDQEAGASALLKIRPINLTLCHALYEYSFLGQVAKTLNRFNKVASLVKIVQGNNSSGSLGDFSRKILEIDRVMLKKVTMRLTPTLAVESEWWRQLMKNCQMEYSGFCESHGLLKDCSFSSRLFLVSYTYHLLPLLLQGPFSPAPCEQLIFHPNVDHSHLSTSILIIPDENIPISLSACEEARGPCTLYIGSKTRDPVKTLRLSNFEGVEAGVSIQMYLKIQAWLKAHGCDPLILSFIDSQIYSKCPIAGILDVLTTSGTAGGTMQHRFDSPGSVRGSYLNNISVISTWYQISSNTAIDLSRGTDDYFIFYQELFQHIFARLRFTTPIQSPFSVQINMDCCSYRVDMLPFSLSEELHFPLAPKAFILDFSPDHLARIKKELSMIQSLKSLNSAARVDKSQLLSGIIALQVAKEIRSYNIGRDKSSLSQRHRIGPQSSYNLSVLRDMKVKDFLGSLVLQFAVSNGLGVFESLDEMILFLRANSVGDTLLVDIRPYEPLLEAIKASGKLKELLDFSGLPMKWGVFQGNLIMLRAIFSGMWKEALSLLSKRSRSVVVIEVPSADYNITRPYHVILSWFASQNRRTSFPRRKMSQEQMFVKLKNWSYPKVLLTHDVGELLMQGRLKESVPINASSQLLYKIPLQRADLWTVVGEVPVFYDLERGVDNFDEPANPTNRTIAIPDWAHHLGSDVGSSSDNYLKLLVTIGRQSELLDELDTIIVLGDGAGGTSAVMAHLTDNIPIISVSKWVPSDHSSGDVGNYVPCDLYCSCDLIKRMKIISDLSSGRGNICSTITWKEIDNATSSIEGVSSFVVLDADLDITDMLEALRLMATSVTSASVQWIYIRVKATICASIYETMIALYGRRYCLVDVVIPFWTNSLSPEICMLFSTSLPMVKPFCLLEKLKQLSYISEWALHLNDQLHYSLAEAAHRYKTKYSFKHMDVQHHLHQSGYPYSKVGFLASPTINALSMLVHYAVSNESLLPRGVGHMVTSDTKGTAALISDLSGDLITLMTVVNIGVDLMIAHVGGSSRPKVQQSWPTVIGIIDKAQTHIEVVSLRKRFISRVGDLLFSEDNTPIVEISNHLLIIMDLLRQSNPEWGLTSGLKKVFSVLTHASNRTINNCKAREELPLMDIKSLLSFGKWLEEAHPLVPLLYRMTGSQDSLVVTFLNCFPFPLRRSSNCGWNLKWAASKEEAVSLLYSRELRPALIIKVGEWDDSSMSLRSSSQFEHADREMFGTVKAWTVL